jgi:hypothetical protein
MKTLYNKRERWAACWTWAHNTLGMDSTQRAEAVHSAVANFLTASMLLTTLYDRLQSYSSDVAARAEAKQESLATAQGVHSSLLTVQSPAVHSEGLPVSPPLWGLCLACARSPQSLALSGGVAWCVLREPSVARSQCRSIWRALIAPAISRSLWACLPGVRSEGPQSLTLCTSRRGLVWRAMRKPSASRTLRVLDVARSLPSHLAARKSRYTTPLVTSLRSMISSHSYKLVEAQAAQAMHYKVEREGVRVDRSATCEVCGDDVKES